MADRDDTNSGVAFPPHQDQELMAQGKLNIDGRESRCIVMFEQLSRDKPRVRVVYLRAGVLFDNSEAKEKNDKAPDFSGPLDDHPNLRVAAWRGEKDGKRYLSLRVSPKTGGGGGGVATDDNGWGNSDPARQRPSGDPQQQQQTKPMDRGYIEDDIPF